MVRNLIGAPVTGADFFDRKRERKKIWDYLHRDHLLLLAPRRVGKTSLMLQLRQEGPGKGIAAAYLSAAEADDEPAFVRRLFEAVASLDAGARALQQISKSPLGKFLKKVKKIGAFGFSLELDATATGEWERLGEALTSALDHQDGRWLVLVDELPMFVLTLVRHDPSGARARKFLSWFRSLRQRGDLAGEVRWLLAGSIGLDTVAARLNLGDTINDLHIVHLGPFRRPEADRLLAELALAYDLPLSEEIRSHMLHRVGWLIPYHLQILFATLREHCDERGIEPSPEAVDAAFEDLLSPARKAYFDYWRQRLGEELGKPDGDHALALLVAIAPDEAGASRDTLSQVLGEHVSDPPERAEKLRYLLDVLEGDGYLVEEGGRYRFRSPLLREFWLRRVVP